MCEEQQASSICDLVLPRGPNTITLRAHLCTRRPYAALHGGCCRQAPPGRHPATAYLNFGSWNVGSMGIFSNTTYSTPRKSAIINLELNHLTIGIAAISETWLTGSGLIREENYTIHLHGYPHGEPLRHGIGLAIHNSLKCSESIPVRTSPSLMSVKNTAVQLPIHNH